MADIQKYARLEDVNLRSPCAGYERTEVCAVFNYTNAKITLCLFQVTCRYEVLPDPYILDTGVFVGGVNEPAGQNVAADPCEAGGFNAPIAGTWGSCSLEYDDPILGTGTVNMGNYPEAEEGSYYPTMSWELSYNRGIRSSGDERPSLLLARRNTGGLARLANSR